MSENLQKSLHQINKSNTFSINYIQSSLESIKKEVAQSLIHFSHCSVTFNQEGAFLNENLEQV